MSAEWRTSFLHADVKIALSQSPVATMALLSSVRLTKSASGGATRSCTATFMHIECKRFTPGNLSEMGCTEVDWLGWLPQVLPDFTGLKCPSG